MPFGRTCTIVHQGDENAFESCLSKIHFRGQNLKTQSQMSSAKYFLAYYTLLSINEITALNFGWSAALPERIYNFHYGNEVPAMFTS